MVQPKEPNFQEKQLVALGRVLQTLREEENSDLLLETILNYLQAEFEYDLVWVGLYDRVDHRLYGKGGATPTGVHPILKQRLQLSPGDVLEQVVIQQRPVAVPDLRAEIRAGEWRKAAQTFNIQGTLIFPIRYRDICYGVVILGTLHWGMTPTAEVKARLSMILGELAAALHKIESDWQREQIKRADEPLLALLMQLRSISGLGQRLEAVVEAAQQFIEPSRTSLYWFERERRYFWRRLTNRQKGGGLHESNQPASGITVQEVSGFYQALVADQLVSVGEAHSSLKADTTVRLMQQIRARSLMAAPILFQNDLLGFLAVEGNEARIWTDGEKDFLRAAAQLVALTAPVSDMEAVIQEIKVDQALTAEIAHAIYSEEDWKDSLEQTANHLCQRLKADRFIVLLYDTDVGEFTICYQRHPVNRRPLLTSLPIPNETDWKLLCQSSEPISIENLEGDLKLMEWRQSFLDLGTKSLLLCSTSLGRYPEGIVVVGYETLRTWSREERDLLRVVSRQLSIILHSWQIQQHTEQQERLNRAIHQTLIAIQQEHQLDELERTTLQSMSDVLQVPLAALVTWLPGRSAGRIITPINHNERFSIKVDMVIPVQTDLLLQWALDQQGMIDLAIADVPANTRHWLNGSGIGRVLVTALRTAPHHEPTAVLVLADSADRRWSDFHLRAIESLTSQLAWARRSIALPDLLLHQRQELQRLNWYKHRYLQDLHRIVAGHLKRLSDLGPPSDSLAATRFQQLIHQVNDVLAQAATLEREEFWQTRLATASIPLVSLLKRALERVDGLTKQQQLWSQVHDEDLTDSNISLGSDVIKIELVLYEVLAAACQRSPVQGRIDLWCRHLNAQLFELSITDHGHVEPRLLEELKPGRTCDRLAPSILDHPPGLHLLICKLLMQQMGGDLELEKLEDDRIVSRLLLPLARGDRPSRSSRSQPPNPSPRNVP